MSTFPIIVATRFGRKNFAAVLRYISFFLVLQMFGYLIAGRSFDLTGSYDTAYAVFLGLDMVAAGLLLSLNRDKSSIVISTNHHPPLSSPIS